MFADHDVCGTEKEATSRNEKKMGEDVEMIHEYKENSEVENERRK